ncbi:hypothetical protein Mp_8g04440 [Marchantia polymorpha subsp. ruderalis]|uniref:Uncharacterized protein n=1 Tax=Marchantia polymorpha TaxID=3197 RepID=A0A2R6VZZ1_MARPO|nr:hypothetical protein MARPO_0216s0006 [Marchantia polymorpha]BBN18672.1 hypothetical protein Mp_8g04440 [Marchantia polymorpha subsp. ruderalis]|eukprot:PTQ27161.1 hypothetical protein MARPO_0216s0006 [Marchantia polymorpha]
MIDRLKEQFDEDSEEEEEEEEIRSWQRSCRGHGLQSWSEKENRGRHATKRVVDGPAAATNPRGVEHRIVDLRIWVRERIIRLGLHIIFRRRALQTCTPAHSNAAGGSTTNPNIRGDLSGWASQRDLCTCTPSSSWIRASAMARREDQSTIHMREQSRAEAGRSEEKHQTFRTRWSPSLGVRNE